MRFSQFKKYEADPHRRCNNCAYKLLTLIDIKKGVTEKTCRCLHVVKFNDDLLSVYPMVSPNREQANVYEMSEDNKEIIRQRKENNRRRKESIVAGRQAKVESWGFTSEQEMEIFHLEALRMNASGNMRFVEKRDLTREIQAKKVEFKKLNGEYSE